MRVKCDRCDSMIDRCQKLEEALALALYYVEGDTTWEALKHKIEEIGIRLDGLKKSVGGAE